MKTFACFLGLLVCSANVGLSQAIKEIGVREILNIANDTLDSASTTNDNATSLADNADTIVYTCLDRLDELNDSGCPEHIKAYGQAVSNLQGDIATVLSALELNQNAIDEMSCRVWECFQALDDLPLQTDPTYPAALAEVSREAIRTQEGAFILDGVADNLFNAATLVNLAASNYWSVISTLECDCN